MLYFIPAWYKKREWCESEENWRVKRMYSEFDDTVKQIQLFHRSGGYDYQIMLLGFSPNFRHFLHRQGVFRVPYWSCFDAIQEVRRKKAEVLSFHDLDWPEGIEFLYTPFVVAAMLGQEKYAQIDFAEDGNPIWVELYQNGTIFRRDLFDDRGFTASMIFYENGQPVYQDYLTEAGIWKLRRYDKDGHVEINAGCPEYLLECGGLRETRQFSRITYENMDQVICEVLSSYLELTDTQDVFCIAMHNLHAKLLGQALKGKKRILSFYHDRYQILDDPDSLEMIRSADYVVVDSKDNAKKLQSMLQIPADRLAAIPPYDTRVDEGLSLQSGLQKLMMAVDGLDSETFGEAIRILGGYLPLKKGARVHLFTREAGYDSKQRLLERTRTELAKNGMPEEWAGEAGNDVVSENGLEEDGKVPVLFVPEQCVDELSVSKCMREQWLIIDLREVPELYLQINAISFEIPQIVRKKTEFITDGGNGIILDRLEKLPQALDYYLDGLEHWNEAKIFSYEISKKYTTERLLEMWGEVMDSVG
ncbi:MAG: accessory Sec system protein Asp1 [Ruminococcus sp.]|nr:accessory Sec system protein Asp1 [Ruminococcus sp.]